MNLFQQYRAKRANKIGPPAGEPPPLPEEIPTKFKPIQINDAQHALLTRALRPGDTPVLEDIQGDAPGPNVAAMVEGGGPPPAQGGVSVSPNPSKGTPIV